MPMLLQPRLSSRSSLVSRPSYLRGIVRLLALVLLLAELGALAHELDHQIQKPDAPCALCLFADHLDKSPVSSGVAIAVVIPSSLPRAQAVSILRLNPLHRSSIRGPPASSETIIV